MRMDRLNTFRDLDGDDSFRPPQSMLEEWYLRMRDIPIGEFELFDIGRACRQNLFVEIVVPLALEKLQENPLAGELYDGELLIAMKSVERSYWETHPDEKAILLSVAQRAYSEEENRDFKIEF